MIQKVDHRIHNGYALEAFVKEMKTLEYCMVLYKVEKFVQGVIFADF